MIRCASFSKVERRSGAVSFSDFQSAKYRTSCRSLQVSDINLLHLKNFSLSLLVYPSSRVSRCSSLKVLFCAFSTRFVSCSASLRRPTSPYTSAKLLAISSVFANVLQREDPILSKSEARINMWHRRLSKSIDRRLKGPRDWQSHCCSYLPSHRVFLWRIQLISSPKVNDRMNENQIVLVMMNKVKRSQNRYRCSERMDISFLTGLTV